MSAILVEVFIGLIYFTSETKLEERCVHMAIC